MGWKRLLASLLTPALAAGWQGTEDSRKAFRELCCLLAALAGALAVLVPGSCSIPCRMHQGRGAGGSGPWQQGLPWYRVEEQCHSSQHR